MFQLIECSSYAVEEKKFHQTNLYSETHIQGEGHFSSTNNYKFEFLREKICLNKCWVGAVA